MSVAIYEFPLCEKVRNYLRLEQLFKQLDNASSATSELQHLHFFDVLFTLADLLERVDLRTDFIRDLDTHEKKLVQWSSHPDIDSNALDRALQDLHRTIAALKKTNKLGMSLKDDRFLSSIKQRFSIPGGATEFDLPNLFGWIRQSEEQQQTDKDIWLDQLELVRKSMQMLLSYLREQGQFTDIRGENGFFQGNLQDRIDLVRVKCRTDQGYYPIVSGNKYRYGIKFMSLDPAQGSTGAVTDTVEFSLACC